MAATFIRVLEKPESSNDINSIISLVNDAFMEDAFFKIPERRQRLKKYKDDPFGVENIEDIVKVSDFIACFSAIEDTKEMLGCIRVEVADQKSTASFGMLSVPKRNQRRGIGRQLVLAAEDWARQKNCSRMEISVVNIRTPVVEFYERLNYKAFGEPIGFDEMLGGKFLGDEYKGIVKFVWMGKDI
jgi:GNAT superfamily N-acetyltransferase